MPRAYMTSIQTPLTDQPVLVHECIFLLGHIRAVAEGGAIPARTVRPRRAKALRFQAGGKTVYAKSARIPARRIPSSAKERGNLGFHRRGAERAMRRSRELLLRAIRKAGVPV